MQGEAMRRRLLLVLGQLCSQCSEMLVLSRIASYWTNQGVTYRARILS